jgi:hypothetical protein
MSSEGSDVTVIAAIMHLDGTIITTRVEMAIVDSETVYPTSMSSESSNEAVIAGIPHLDCSIITTRVQLASMDSETVYKISMSHILILTTTIIAQNAT